jgi:farnesyl diphosphate synthase
LIPIRPELTPSLRAYGARVEAVLARTLPREDAPPEILHRAMRYAVLGGGKRIRPMLAYATCAAFGRDAGAADGAAAAVEIIHGYSLAHDDLPAMDNDTLRRGQPTCHVAFGEANAILAGDALQALAFELLADPALSPVPESARLAMTRALAQACGSHGMAGGQAFDLAAVGVALSPSELERMHVHKTGALIRASVRLGALAAGVADFATLAALERYAHAVGLAFQIRDDVLDIEGETAVIGKTRGKDEAANKPTYPAILGTEASIQLAARLRTEALAALEGAGIGGSDLVDLAHYAVDRSS